MREINFSAFMMALDYEYDFGIFTRLSSFSLSTNFVPLRKMTMFNSGRTNGAFICMGLKRADSSVRPMNCKTV
jgi:hypothetical protein